MTVATLAPADDIAALARAASGESLTIRIAPGRDPLASAMARAALAPLAIECAPMRVNAVLAGQGAAAGDVEAAVAFLERAVSTTGQVLEIIDLRSSRAKSRDMALRNGVSTSLDTNGA